MTDIFTQVFFTNRFHFYSRSNNIPNKIKDLLKIYIENRFKTFKIYKKEIRRKKNKNKGIFDYKLPTNPM